MRELIIKNDEKVTEKIGNIMSSKNCLIYEQEGVFKYGLAQTKNHFSFHSMVMYANAEIRDFIVNKSKLLKIQKGCINFKNADEFSHALFAKFIKLSAQADFSPIINHYKNRK